MCYRRRGHAPLATQRSDAEPATAGSTPDRRHPPSADALDALRALAAAPSGADPGPAAADPEPPDRLPAAYRRCSSELVRIARRLTEVLDAFVGPLPPACLDLRGSLGRVTALHQATAAVGHEMSDATGWIATLLRDTASAADPGQRSLCADLGPQLCAEWRLMTASLATISSGCRDLMHHLDFLVRNAADISVRRGALDSTNAAVGRGLQVSQRRITQSLAAMHALLDRIDSIDAQRGPVNPCPPA